MLQFDTTFYLTTYPDVAAAISRGTVASAQDHYNNFGRFEGRNPSAFFDTAFYLAQNADVAAARVNPFTHFLQFGVAEGRFANNTADAAIDANNNNRADEFNATAYLAANPDVAGAVGTGKAFASAYQHYILFGQFEGRAGVTGGPFTNSGVAPGTGSNFALTSNIDALTGTTGNDTFTAGVTGAGDATLNPGDSLNGGSGTDQIQLFGNTNAGNFAGANVTNVEQVYAQFSATSGALDVSGNAGVQQAWISKGTIGADGATVTLTKAQTAGVTGTVAGAGAATFSFTDTAGAADTASLALNGATLTKGVTVANIETLNIAATGTNAIGTLTAAAASTVNITGSGSLTAVLSDSAAYKTIDASAATGNIVIDASAANAANQVISIKTGAGADNYTTLFANLTNADKIDLGAGNDTLSFADATDLSTSANAGKLSGVANVEALRVTGAGAFKADGDLITQTKFVHDSTGAFTGTNFASTDSLVVEDSAAAASTVAMKLGQSTFNLGLEGSKTAISDASAGITVTGASTVNVSSSGFADQGANKVGLTTDGNGTINLTGAKDLVVTAAVNSGSTGLSIDGSSFTGKLDITGSANGDIIKGGAGADTIRAFGAGVDTLTGGAGADKFVVFGTDADTAANAIAVTDIITDFVSGTDTLSGFTAAGSATNFAKATAVSAALSDFITAADTALNGTVKYYVGQVGSDAYVAYDDNGTGFTSLVKLTGVSLAGVAQGDIVAA